MDKEAGRSATADTEQEHGTITFRNSLFDRPILMQAKRVLARHALNHVTAEVRSDNVKLAGILRFEFERRIALEAVDNVDGVRHVIDQMQVRPNSSWS